MALAVEEDVALDPMDVRLLGAVAVVAGADGLADAIEEPRLRRLGRTGLVHEEPRAERFFRRHGVHDASARASGNHPGGLLLLRPEHR